MLCLDETSLQLVDLLWSKTGKFLKSLIRSKYERGNVPSSDAARVGTSYPVLGFFSVLGKRKYSSGCTLEEFHTSRNLNSFFFLFRIMLVFKRLLDAMDVQTP